MDKEKLAQNRPDIASYDYSAIVLPEIDYEKEIISITTDSNYNSTSEYAEAPRIDIKNVKTSNGSINNSNNVDLTNFKTTSTTSAKPTKAVAPVQTTSASDIFGSIFGFLFKDDDISAETESSENLNDVTIPPFRNITSTISLLDILNISSSQQSADVEKPLAPQRINNKIYENPTTEPMTTTTTTTTANGLPLKNLNILRDVLLDTLNNNNGAGIRDLLTERTIPKNPVIKSSIHQFLSPTFPQILPEDLEPKHAFNPIRSDLDLVLPEQLHKDVLTKGVFNANQNYQILPEYSSVSKGQSYLSNQVDSHRLKEHHSEGPTEIFTKPTSSMKDSVGLLKLAGCNIYGRMYRVGRIISELSSPCLECKCTEYGVHCTPLSC